MFPKPHALPSLRPALNPTAAATPMFMFYNKMLFLFSQKMIRLQKPRRVYVFPSLRTVNPKPFNHTQPSNPQKSLYLLPVCPFAVLLFCSYFTALTPFLAEGGYKCKTNPERVSRRAPAGVCVATETPPGGVSPVFEKGREPFFKNGL